MDSPRPQRGRGSGPTPLARGVQGAVDGTPCPFISGPVHATCPKILRLQRPRPPRLAAALSRPPSEPRNLVAERPGRGTSDTRWRSSRPGRTARNSARGDGRALAARGNPGARAVLTGANRALSHSDATRPPIVPSPRCSASEVALRASHEGSVPATLTQGTHPGSVASRVVPGSTSRVARPAAPAAAGGHRPGALRTSALPAVTQARRAASARLVGQPPRGSRCDAGLHPRRPAAGRSPGE